MWVMRANSPKFVQKNTISFKMQKKKISNLMGRLTPTCWIKRVDPPDSTYFATLSEHHKILQARLSI